MFAHIRRHQKSLWIFISAAVIISFVWYFNPNQTMGGPGAGTAGPVGSMYGEPLERKDYADAYREAVLHYLFSYGEWPEDNEVSRQLRPVERETRQRLLLVRKLKDYNIQVSDEAVADWIVQMFQDRETKRFNSAVLDRFYQTLEQRRLKRSDFERYARHQVGIAHLAAVAGSTGKLVTPQEADFVYRQEHEKVDAKVALLSLTNFSTQVQVTTNALTNFYAMNQSLYRQPERVQMSYVAFPSSNYLVQADERINGLTNLSQQIDSIYQQRGASFYTGPDQQPLSPEAAKARIREEFRREAAMAEARRAAYEFANELEKIPVKTNSPNPAETLEMLAQTKSQAVQQTEPFTQFAGPAALKLPEQFVRMAFTLTPEEPIIPEPVTGEDGMYVMAFKSRVPSSTEPYEAVEARVTEDFRRRESQNLLRSAGITLANILSNGIAAGKSFDAMVQEAGFTVVDIQPFTRTERSIPGLPPQLDPGALASSAFNVAPGQVSSYQPSRDGGFILFNEKFVAVPEDEVQRELSQFVQDLRRRNASESFNQWFAKEMRVAQLNLPGDKTDMGE